MIYNIITLNDLKGKKVAMLNANRNLNGKNVKKLVRSFLKYGQIQPAMICDATKADEDNLEVVDFETGDTITGEALKEYVVILDGQHRYQAYLNLRKGKKIGNGKDAKEVKYEGDFFVYYPINESASIFAVLAEMNQVVTAWNGNDFTKCAATLVEKPNPMIQALAELAAKGINSSSAGKWLTLAGKIDTKDIKDYIQSGGNTTSPALENTMQLENGKMLFKAAEEAGLDYGKFLSPRKFIDWIISKVRVDGQVDNELVVTMCKFITDNGEELRESQSMKADEKEQKWNELWDNM